MKKLLCIVLTLSVLICTFAGLSFQADAAGWSTYAKGVSLNSTFSETGTDSDPYSLMDASYMDIFRFTVPAKGTVTLKLSGAIDSVPFFHVYKTSDTENSLWYGYDGNRSHYDYVSGSFVSNWNIKLGAGQYYLMTLYGSQAMNTNYKFRLNYKPTFSKTSIVSKAGAKKAIKVSWGKKTNVTGYKIQYSLYSSMKYSKTVTIKKSSVTKKTIKGLKSRRTYYVRIKTYKKVKISGKIKTYVKSWSKKKAVKTK